MKIHVGKYSAYEKDYIAISIFHQGHLTFSSCKDADLCESYGPKMGFHPCGWRIEEDSRYDGPFMLKDGDTLQNSLQNVIDILREKNRLGREIIDSNAEERLQELQTKLKVPLAEVEDIIYRSFLSL